MQKKIKVLKKEKKQTWETYRGFDGSALLELPIHNVIVIADSRNHPHHQIYLWPHLPYLPDQFNQMSGLLKCSESSRTSKYHKVK